MCNKFGDGRTEGGVAMFSVQFSRFYLAADFFWHTLYNLN